jgi:patatin-like phospholipase/acyl hydrolase
MKTLLAVDGGGLFGVGVANWVPRLKWKFDYYAGTSVGSILAACYACGIEPLKVQEMFNGDLPKKIFTKPGFPYNLNPLRPATYDNVEAKKVLKDVFGDTKVKDTAFPIVIVAWNYEKRKEKVFTHKFNSEYFLRDAVLASMSAPTYFPVAKIKDENGNENMLGDGGVCGNDPSLAGIAAMRDDAIKTKDIKCLSICTGGVPKEKKLSVSTQAGWLPVVIDVITLGNVGYTSYGVSHVLDERYLRVCPKDLPSGSLDDFSLVPKIRKAWEEYSHLEAFNFLNRAEA